MKKALYIVGGVVALLVLVAIIVPILYKDKIKDAVMTQVNKSVNATVYTNADRFGLSIFSNFPNLTLSLGDFGIIGKEPFAGDTLTHINTFEVEVNLWSAIAGKQIEIEGISLVEPRIYVKVLEDGKANYDIALPDSTPQAAAPEDSGSDLAIQIKHWQIENGTIVYDDRYYKTFIEAKGVNHEGNGDFTLDVFDLRTTSQIQALTVAYDGTAYLTEAVADADVTLNMDLPNFKFTFRENQVKLNEFAFGFNGFFAMPGDDMQFDMTYAAKETEFKNILSIVPGMYSKDFANLKTSGSLAFDGSIKGVYSATKYPGITFNLKVKDGFFQYPDLPVPVKDIQVDMAVSANEGNYEDILVNIANFAMQLGANPVKGRIKSKGLSQYEIDAEIMAKVNLAEVTKIFPIDSLELKGQYTLDLKAKGLYSDTLKSIPTINAVMQLNDGWVKSNYAPMPIEQISVNTTVSNTTGKMADTRIDIQDASLQIDGERLEAKGAVYNFEDYTYNFALKGGLNLDLVNKMFPMPETKLAGRITADVQTAGKMSDIDAGRYDKLPTSGSMAIANFAYASPDFPQGITISAADMTFTPKAVNLNSFNSVIGKSDVALTGAITNYIAYLFNNETLIGNLTLASNKFDVNEWMTEEETPAQPTAASAPLEIVQIPANIDFLFKSTIKELVYTNMKLSDVNGTIVARDGVLKLSGLKFNMLGGSFVTTGTYDPRDKAKPVFDFGLNMTNVAFKEAYTTFNTVQTLAPIAQNISGVFNTDFKLSGLLGQDYMPALTSLSGLGDIKVNGASLSGSAIMNKISELSGLKELNNPKINDVAVKAEVKEGKLFVKPFDVKLGEYVATVEGSTGLDGSINYNVKMNVPVEKLSGTPLAGLTAGYAKLTGSQTIPVTFAVGGTYGAPKVQLVKGNDNTVGNAVDAALEQGKEQAKDAVKDAAQNAINNAVNNALTPKDSANQSVKDQGKQVIDKGKNIIKGVIPGGKKKDN